MKIGIIGNGFVGNAIYQNFKGHYEILVYDTDPERCTAKNIEELSNNAEIIFVAVPTPMDINGNCDISIVSSVMEQIAEHYNDNIIIIKSTIPPGTCKKLNQKFNDFRIVFSPEFLTERNAVEDFKTCNRVIFGGQQQDTKRCIGIFKTKFPNKTYLTTDWKSAEMVKYFLNTFLAAKVSFANEIYQICEATDISYDTVLDLVTYDPRVTRSHFSVPGPDSYCGFGGVCFPKDINALINICKQNNVDSTMLSAAWNKNLLVRKNHDWLKLEGRAISTNEVIK